MSTTAPRLAPIGVWERLPAGLAHRDHIYGRVSILDTEGTVLSRVGGGPANTPGNFTAPHSIAVDSRGDVYVAEATWTIGVSRGLVPDGTPTPQKLTRFSP